MPPSVPTFKDHCVVDDAWLASAYAQRLPFVWHPKIEAVLRLADANALDLDRCIALFPWAGGADPSARVASHKRDFFAARKVVQSVRDRMEKAYPRLLDSLEPTGDPLRARALHTFAAAAALTLVKVLQRFEGLLFTEQGQLILRLFPDIPFLGRQSGAMIGLPFLHPINGLAYGHEADQGFLRARICSVSESDYVKLPLPRHDAECWQDCRPAPEHLYFGWVLPQWLVSGSGDVPEASRWRIAVLVDELGRERDTRSAKAGWGEPLVTRAFVEEAYAGLTNERCEQKEAAPGLRAWVLRMAASAKPTPETQGAVSSKAEISDISIANESAADHTPIILCITAARVEFAAARTRFEAEFGEATPVSIEGESDYAVLFTDTPSGTRWLLAVQSFQAEIDAALKAQRLVLTLKPTATLMVGMCMGMPKRKIAVGTVVVPNEVQGFDHQRVTPAGVEFRGHGDLANNPLFDFASTFDCTELGYEVVADKGLASASVKIEDVDAALLKHIENRFPDAMAYDMEGWGFYRGVKAARAGASARCLWIKGIADSGETQVADAAGRAGKHAVQADATANALDFAIRLIRGYVGVKRFEVR